MKRFMLVAAFIAVSIISYAQFVLNGNVKDQQSGNPIAGATVYIPNTSVATYTDEKGNFQLHTKRQFNQIGITSIGYSNSIVTVIDKSQFIQISLNAVPSTLAPVEILGVRQPQAVNTLTENDLKRYSGLNLQDAINNIPGVVMQSRTPWGGQRIVIRGYYPSVDNGRSNSANFAGLGYQLFIDNIPVTDATGTTVMDDIDFLNLGKVEVIKGPSPLYGSYIAGAVNFFSPKPAPNQSGIQQQVIGGSYGLFRSNTTVQSSNGNSSIRLNYGHQTYEGFRPHNNSKKDYFNFTSNLTVSDRNVISSYFSYNNSYEDLAGEIDSADFYGRKAVSNLFYVLNNSHAAIESFRAGVTDRYEFTDLFSNQTTVFATGSTLNQSFAHGFTKNQNISFGGRTAFYFDDHANDKGIEGQLGASFIRTNQDAHGNFIPPFIFPPFTPNTTPNIASASRNYAMNYTIFTQWKFGLPGDFKLTAGGSLNFIEFATQNLLHNGTIYLDNPISIKVFKPVFRPSLSLIKSLNEGASAYASISTGYAPATLSQMTRTDGTINTDLKPEKGIQYEVGVKGTSGALKNMSYQVAVFDLEVTDRLIQQTSNSISFYTNAGKQRNLGAEVFLSYDVIKNKKGFISGFKPWLSYAWSHFKYVDFLNHGKSSNGGDTILASYSGNKVAGIPENVFNIGMDLQSTSGIYFSTSFRYNDKVPITFTNTNYMKAYSLLNARLGFRKQFNYHFGLDVFAGADNISSSTYYSMVFVGQSIQELAQANDPYITGGGGDGYILPAPYKATFYGGLSLKYNF